MRSEETFFPGMEEVKPRALLKEHLVVMKDLVEISFQCLRNIKIPVSVMNLNLSTTKFLK